MPSPPFPWILKQRLTTWSCVIFRILNLLSSFRLELPGSLRPNLEQHISFCHILEPMGSLRRSLKPLTSFILRTGAAKISPSWPVTPSSLCPSLESTSSASRNLEQLSFFNTGVTTKLPLSQSGAFELCPSQPGAADPPIPNCRPGGAELPPFQP